MVMSWKPNCVDVIFLDSAELSSTIMLHLLSVLPNSRTEFQIEFGQKSYIAFSCICFWHFVVDGKKYLN